MRAKGSDNWMIRFDKWLWRAQHSGDSRLLRGAWHSVRVVFAVVRDILYGDITLHAMGLVYTTLLSLIPFLALSFSVLTALGVHNQLEPVLENFLAPLGERAPIITDNILRFVDNIRIGVLGFAGMGFLIYTVISLVQKIESAFNEIWRVSQLRSFGQRFSNYLSVIIIGPVLVASALGTTGTLVASDFVSDLRAIAPFGWLFTLVGQLAPFFLIIALFTFLYVFIPNTRVKVKYAAIGGVVAGIVWQWTSIIFAEFVAGSTRYEAIYSSFVVGILILWWLYLAWLILLTGAAVSFYAQHAHQITRARRSAPCATVDERTGLAILYRVAQQFDSDGGSVSLADLDSHLSVGPEVVQRMSRKLIRYKLLATTSDNSGLLPARSLDKMHLKDVLEIIRCPEGTIPASLSAASPVTEMAKLVEYGFEQQIGDMTVADWVREGEPMRETELLPEEEDRAVG